MSNYRRARTPGASYFFTVVTFRRRQILTTPFSRAMLREALAETREKHSFVIDAWVLLPDHIHCVWTLPENDGDFSARWRLIKTGYTKRMKNRLHNEGWLNDSRQGRRESTVWQRRFWEHRIRDERDYRQHIDYIHYNPLKHGLVTRVVDWPYSTFHRCVKQGVYPPDWCGDLSQPEGDFGE